MELFKAIKALRSDRFFEKDVENVIAILAVTKGVDLLSARRLLEDRKVH